MKKITFLLLAVFYSLVGYSQYYDFENVEVPGVPSGWLVTDNGVGLIRSWRSLNTVQDPPLVLEEKAVFIQNEEIGMGNTSLDFLITEAITVPVSGQLRFFARQGITGNQGTIYEVRYSTNMAAQGDISQYQLLQSWTEPEMNSVFSTYEEHVVDLVPTLAANQQVYIAFVRVFTQPGIALGGDRWYLDNINIVPECINPANLEVEDVASTFATLVWEHEDGVAINYEYELIPATASQSGMPNGETGNADLFANITTASNLLQPDSGYKYFLRAECSENVFGDWVGPFFFNTLPLGTVCAEPIDITSLPYETDGNTGDYGNTITATQGNFPLCGATPAGTNFYGGNDVIYRVVIPADAPVGSIISITLTPGAARSSVFVYDECADIGSACLAGLANTNSTTRVIDNFEVTPGEDYYVVISSSLPTQTLPYNLIIQYETCDKPTDLAAANPTTTGADLSWTDVDIQPTTSWNIAVQPAGSSIPTGPGQYTTPANGVPSFQVTDLNNPNQSQYQYWVRRLCPDGQFSSWAGPFLFNTLLCNPADQCTFIFRTNDTANNGWNNAKMQVFQNGIVVPVTFGGADVPNGLIGNNVTGPAAQDFEVKLCPNIPFELKWQAQGSAPQQCIVAIINPFGQTIYTHTLPSSPVPPAGTLVGTTVYSEVVNCSVQECDIAPINVAVVAGSLGTTNVTIDWEAPATETFGWDIYVVETGGAVPTAATVPTYSNVTTADKPFTIPNAINPGFTLIPDTAYDVYVRVQCTPNDSPWSSVMTFTTIPTCPKPTDLGVVEDSITQTGATLSWTNGTPGDNAWEILLVPGLSMTPPTEMPPLNPIPAVGDEINDGLFYTVAGPLTPTTYTVVDDLEAATIYYYYIRTVCPGDDKSTWAGPFVFHTVTCDEETKCEYKFYPTNTGANNWGNGRMEVRQNGIIVAVIGASQINSANPVIVKLCPDVPFDLFWSIAGNAPENIGITIQNPFLDVIYTKLPGQGTVETILYDSIGNCTDAPCAKPTDITVSNVGPTAVQITWTDNSLSPSLSFDLYVVETGGPAPINNPATTPTHTGVQSGDILSTLNGNSLSPSTSYTFYVRAVCSDTDTSTWTIQTPVTFITTPVNDLCINATPVTINPGQECVAENTATGNTYGSNFTDITTVDPISGAGCNPTNQDVWYSFVATATSHTIVISNIVATPETANVTLNHSVFSGPCDNMELLYCSSPLVSGASGLTIGETYYIRVYKSSNIASQSATFELCILSPPANDECSGAITVTPNSGQECLSENVVSSGTLGATNSPVALDPASDPLAPANLCGPTNDDVWFKFIATSANHTIIVSNVVPTPSNATVKLNYALFSGPCDNLNLLFCSNTYTTPTSGLVIGNTYYVRVYKTTTNPVQSATFDICIISPPANDECANAIPVTVNPEQFCLDVNTVSGNTIGSTASMPDLTPPLSGAGCGASNRDIWYSFVATATSNMISFSNIVTNPSGLAALRLNHSVFAGTCEGLEKLYCSTAEVSQATGLIEGNTYYVRVYTSTTLNDHSLSFDMCITSPPANDECPDSMEVTVNTGQICAPENVIAGSTLGASPSLPQLTPPLTGAGCFPNNNDIWYHFVATQTSHAINLSNIFITPSNANVSLNYGVFSGSCDNLTKLYCSTNNYSNATGLTIGETYYIRIYTTNTNVQHSITFDLCITSPPVNDDCANAIVAPVNEDFSCDDRIFGSTIGATQSLPTITGAGCTGTNDDVWYKFTAGPGGIHFINLNSLGANNNTVTLSHAVFAGTCDALGTPLYCTTEPNSTAMNLTPGQDYYIRVYTAGVLAGDWVNFNLCIKTPPPPAENEDCDTATPIIANIGGQCITIGSGNLIEAGPSGVANTCVGNADDDVWFSFEATSTQHFINIFNVEGTTNNLNHAVYSSDCSDLDLLYCSAGNTLNSTNGGFVVGNTYFIRVWSNTNTPQIVAFDICIKSKSTCETAEPFCVTDTTPLIFPNSTQVPSVGQVACLFTTPNPTYYYLQVQNSGNLVFNIRQSTDPNNFPAAGAPGIDVDFVAWGPFESPEACDEIVLGPCTPGCPNNTGNPNFYFDDLDNSNVVDCSYDGAVTENFTIQNAVAGQYYILLLTNFNQQPGYIRLSQSNSGEPNSGTSTNLCCEVDLGEDIVTCQPSVILDAIGEPTAAPQEDSYVWYYNNGIIPGATSSTYEATQTGVYRAEGSCGLNSASDEVFVEFLPAVVSTQPADYLVCDDATNDGVATFDLQTITPATVVVDGLLYSISIHATEDEALEPASAIDVTVPYETVSTTLFIRIQSNSITDCYTVQPINLVVNVLENSEFEYDNIQYCQSAVNPLPTFLNNGIAGNFTATPAGLSINPTTGEINLASSAAGIYTITNTLDSNGACNPSPSTFVLTIAAQKEASFTYDSTEYCNDGTTAPIFGANAEAGTFTVAPTTGLDINPTTGQINLTNSTLGVYVITNTIAATGGCLEDVAEFTITVTESTTATIAYNDPFCLSLSEVQNVILTGNATGTFSSTPVGLSLNATTGAITPSTSTPGTYTVNYFVAAQGSCDEINASATVTILAAATYEFVHGCEGGAYKLIVQPLNNSFDITTSTFVWAGVDFTPVADEPNAIIVRSQGEYSVTITTAEGCITVTDFVNLTSIGCQIQKGISPNNDGDNDSFDLSAFNVREISIFNRYGTDVYNYSNYVDQWYGQSSNGKELPDGTYFYVFQTVDGQKVTGWIYINR
ncbi:T9SS type B sorting domain-containing protein [Flavobacterium soli]|uniref:T9SS type B sorting domain-containing protein n=1 Tax=Flavobacterium soli TaxID=344881 RepID=UPI00047D46EF|nr:gliding motility-associated C-terminal domain-containing protein [Flavobacterium soli]